MRRGGIWVGMRRVRRDLDMGNIMLYLRGRVARLEHCFRHPSFATVGIESVESVRRDLRERIAGLERLMGWSSSWSFIKTLSTCGTLATCDTGDISGVIFIHGRVL